MLCTTGGATETVFWRFRHCPASESRRRRSGGATEAREFDERTEPAGVKELRRVHRDPYAHGGRVPGRRRGSQVTPGGLCGAGRTAEAEGYRGGPEPFSSAGIRRMQPAAGEVAKAIPQRFGSAGASENRPRRSNRATKTARRRGSPESAGGAAL